MREFVRNRPFLAFYALAFGIATLVWIYIVSMELLLADSQPGGYSLFAHFYETQARIAAAHPVLHHHNDSVLLYLASYAAVPVAFAAFFFPFAPTLSAIATVGTGWGRSAVRVLLSLYRPVRGNIGWRRGLGIYALLVGLMLIVAALSVLRVQLAGEPERAQQFLHHLGVIDWRYLLTTWTVAMFLNQGGLLEELGWRGFAYPLLAERLGKPLLGALVVGVAWTFWHLPREIPTLLSGQQTFGGLIVGQFWFLILCVSTTLVAVFFSNLAGGSVLPAIMVHGSLNFIGGMLATDKVGPRSAFSAEAPLTWAAVAVIVLVLAGRDLGWKHRVAATWDLPPLPWVRRNEGQ